MTRPFTRQADAEASGGASQAETSEKAGAEAADEVAGPAGAPASASTDGEDSADAEPSASGDDMQVSVVPGITRYHRGNCQLIRFLSVDDLDLMTKRAATESGCVPCKACKPDQVGADVPVG